MQETNSKQVNFPRNSIIQQFTRCHCLQRLPVFLANTTRINSREPQRPRQRAIFLAQQCAFTFKSEVLFSLYYSEHFKFPLKCFFPVELLNTFSIGQLSVAAFVISTARKYLWQNKSVKVLTKVGL